MTPERLWDLLIDLAVRDGAAPMNRWPECWTRRVGAWRIAINGHAVEMPVKFDAEGPAMGVPPYHLFAEWEGWPAILMSPLDGVAMPGAIEDLGAAIEAALSAGGSGKSRCGGTGTAPGAAS